MDKITLNYKDMKVIFTLLGIFVFGMTFANIVAGIKIVNIFGLIVPSAVLTYAFLTFPTTDIVAEIYGKKIANLFVAVGFTTQLVFILFIYLTGLLPPQSPKMQALYNKVFSTSTRVILASLVAFLASQTHDIFAFHWLGKKTNGKHLWLRNNVSTIISQAIDTIIFITLAFYGTIPNHTLLTMISSQYIIKFIIALLDTPIVYSGVHLIKKYTNRSSSFTTQQTTK